MMYVALWHHMQMCVWVSIAWQYQATIRTNVDLLSKVFCGIYLKIISGEKLNRKHYANICVKGEYQSTLQKQIIIWYVNKGK